MQIKLNKVSPSIQGVPLFEPVSLEINPGEFWAVLGPNGIGKSTLLNSLILLHQEFQGDILIDQHPIGQMEPRYLARCIGLMQQEYQYIFPQTVIEAVSSCRYPYQSWQKMESIRESHQHANDSLMQCGIQQMAERSIQTLSGGEKRLLHLAMLMTQSPALLLLDEPTNHLDLHHQQHMMKLLQKLLKTGQHAIFMVTHDYNLAIRHCDKVLLIFPNKQWICGHPQEIMDNSVMQQLYQTPLQRIQHQEHVFFVPS